MTLRLRGQTIGAAFIAAVSISACSEKETIVTEVKLTQKTQLEVLGVVAESERINVTDIIDKGSDYVFAHRPQMAARLGVSEAYINGAITSYLDNHLVTQEMAFRGKMAEYATLLNQASPQQIAHDEENRQLMADLFARFAGSKHHDIGFIDPNYGHLPYIINPINSPLFGMLDVFNDSIELSTVADASRYLSILEQLEVQIEQINQRFITDANAHWLPPKSIINESLKRLQAFTQQHPEKHILYRQLQHKLAASTLSDADKQPLLAKAWLIIQTQLLPKYKKVAETLITYSQRSNDQLGIWATGTEAGAGSGDAFYQYVLAQQINANLDAEQIHRLGLADVEQISSDIGSVLQQLGYRQGTVNQRLKALSLEARFLQADTFDATQTIERLKTQLNQLAVHLHDYFKLKQPPLMIIQQMPMPQHDVSGISQYVPASADGERRARLLINTSKLATLPSYFVPTLLFNRGLPGQHMQSTLQIQQQNVPALRLLGSYQPFTQGWALYAEQLAYEMDAYHHQPFANIGRLQSQLLHSVRLVIDTGIHAKQWTREQAINYVQQTLGLSTQQATDEVLAVISLPGQALAAKLGMMRIQELRNYAKSILNRRFNISTFNDVVLQHGALPLPMLDRQINYWIRGEQ